MATLSLEILTPTFKLEQILAESVQLPGQEGELGVLAGHENFIVALKPGVLQAELVASREAREYIISHGVARIQSDRCIVMVNSLIEVGEINHGIAAENIQAIEADIVSHGNKTKLEKELEFWKAVANYQKVS